jgi:hypothetical protein
VSAIVGLLLLKWDDSNTLGSLAMIPSNSVSSPLWMI